MADLREPSVSWSMKAESGGNPESPGRVSATDFSNRASSNTANVSRGDSLAYSDDSQDQRNLIKPQPVVPRKQCCKDSHTVEEVKNMNDSMMSDESFKSKAACCVIQ